MNTCLQFSELLQAFFTDRLMHQREASPNTIASYRDTFSPALAVCTTTNWQAAYEADDGGSGTRLPRSLP